MHVRLSNLLANFRRPLPQRLRGLLPRLLVANVRPQPRLLILLQKSSRRILRSDGFHDASRHEWLAPLAGVDVVDLAIFDPLAILSVARMVVRAASSSAQHIVIVWCADALHLLFSGFGRCRRRIAPARHNPCRMGKGRRRFHARFHCARICRLNSSIVRGPADAAAFIRRHLADGMAGKNELN